MYLRRLSWEGLNIGIQEVYNDPNILTLTRMFELVGPISRETGLTDASLLGILISGH